MKEIWQILMPLCAVINLFTAFVSFINGNSPAGFAALSAFCGRMVAWAALNGAYEN